MSGLDSDRDKPRIGARDELSHLLRAAGGSRGSAVRDFLRTLRFRLLALVVLGLIPAVALMVYSGLERRWEAGLSAGEAALRLARQAAMDQERIVQGATQLMSVVAHLSGNTSYQSSAVEGLLKGLQQKDPVYARLAVLSPSGQVVSGAAASNDPVSYADAKWFKRAVGERQLVIGEFEVGASGKPELPLAYPVFRDNNELGVMIYAALDLSWLNALASRIDLPAASTLAIIDSKGTILVRHPDPEKWIGKTVHDLGAVQAVLARGEGTFEATGVDGNVRLYAFTPLQGVPPGLFVRMGLRKATVLRKPNEALARNVLVLITVLACSLVGARLFATLFITRDVDLLVHRADQLADGDLSTRTGLIGGSGEIRRLARSFDHMAEALEHRNAEHERVEEELRKSNQYVENLFAESADSIATVDNRGRFTKWNKAASELFGYRPEEIIGTSANRLYDDHNELNRMLIQLRHDGFVRNYEIDMIRKDGTVAPFAVSIRLLKGDDLTVLGSIGIARDLSEIRKNMHDIHIANERLQDEIAERRSVEATLQDTLDRLQATVLELEDRNQHITLLNELGDLLQSCLTKEEAYQCIGRFCTLLFPSMSGTLFMRTPRKSLLLEAVETWGMGQSYNQVFSADDCWGLRRGEVHMVTHSNGGPACKHLPRDFSGPYMCLPMVAQGETQGMLFLQPFPHEEGMSSAGEPNRTAVLDRELAVTVTRQISMALANLGMRESLHIEAIIDPLTGLFNRRYLEQTSEREIFRASRRESEIGVIMIDLDHFKRINDDFGHEAGDMVLAAVAGLLKKSVRKEDIACRYGGEEFLVVLPEAALEQAASKAEQLRNLIGHQELKHMGLAIGKISASFGVAGYPRNGTTLAEIVRNADIALYRAKEQGRDRVVVADKVGEDYYAN